MTTTKKTKQTNGNNWPTCDLSVVSRNGDDKALWTRLFAGWQHKDGKGVSLLPHGQFEVATLKTDGTDIKVMYMVEERQNRLSKTRIGHFESQGGIEYFQFDGDLAMRDRRPRNN